ncbi:MAG: PAS domain S-box protein [Ignavibacteria bacterium]|nr:PAS domain S-box protein [Ignavibacteria bacterium]
MNKRSKTKAQLIKELASLQWKLRAVERTQSRGRRDSGRTHTQENLLRKDALLNQIMDHMHDVVVLTDSKMVLRYVTPSVRTILGYDPQKIVGTPALALIHEDDIEGVSKVLTHSLRNKKSGKAEFRYRHAQGHYVWLETLGDLSLNKKGEIEAVVLVCRDITERKRTEDQLRQSEERFRGLLETVNLIAVTLDLNGTVTFCNDYFLHLVQADRADVVGKSWFSNFLPEDQRDQVRAMFMSGIQSAELPARYENEIVARGERRMIRWSNALLHGPQGTIVGTASLGEDITEHRRAEETLRQSEERYRLVLEHIDEIVYKLKLDGSSWRQATVELVGGRVEQILGYAPQEFLADPDLWFKLIHPDDIPSLDERSKHIYRAGKPGTREYRMKHHPTGDFRWIEDRVVPQCDESGQTIGVFGVARDITERKEAEQVLRESEEKFRSLAEQLPNMIFINRLGRVVYANKKCEEAMGYGREEFYSPHFNFLRMIAPEHHELVKTNLARHLGGEDIPPYEYTLVAKDGARIDAIHTTKLTEYGGQRAILGIITDITERKGMEKKLQLSDQILQRVGSLVFVADSNGDIVYASPSAETILGYKPEELLGNGWWSVSKDDPKAGAFEKGRVARVSRRELPAAVSPYEAYVRSRDGELRCILWQDSVGLEGMVIGVGQDITELKRAEEALRQSEIRFKALIEKSADVVAIMDAAGTLVYESPSVKNALGYQPEELVGHNAFELLHPEDQSKLGELFQRVLSTPGGSQSAQFRYKHKDRTWKWFEGTGTNNLEDPSVRGIVINYRDISTRKLAEEELIRLRKAVESSGEVIFMTDRDGTFRFVNPAFTAVYGYTADEVVGLATPRILKSGTMPGESYKTFWEAILSKKLVQAELINTTKDGRLRTIDSSVSPILDDQSEIAGFLAIQRDVTDQRRAEERMREQAALLDITQDAVIVRTMNDEILFWNKGAERIYGWSAEEAIGRNALEILYKHIPKQLEEANKSVLHSGEWSGELSQIRRDQNEVIVESRWTLIRDKNGLPVSKLTVNTDVTSKKRLEKQFLRAQRMESVGTLAGGIAHDLNNVLAPVLISLRILRGKLPLPQDQALLDRLESTVQRGAGLVKQVLTFSRGAEIARAVLQIRHLIEDIKRFVKETFPASIEITTNVPRDLWTVSGDATQIHQILLNLCVNSRDAMPNGGTLTIAAENLVVDDNFDQLDVDAKAGAHVAISVSDTGIGISPEIRDKIFEPFFTTKEVGRGTGLGLSTVYAIVKGHGGFVHVQSEVGMGTIFTVYLPATPSQRIEQPVKEPQELIQGNGELILLVDDETAICEITRITLGNNGYRVITSGDGADALTQYFSHRTAIKLVITDISMPVMDGPALIRALRRLDPELCVIATTGLEDKLKVAEMQLSDVQTFLTKPYTAEKLLTGVHDALRSVS